MPISRYMPLAAILLMTACGACASMGGVPGASDIVMLPVPEETQRHVAVHEMAHAVAAHVLFGEDEVTYVHVHTERCPPEMYVSTLCCDFMSMSHFGSLNTESEGEGWLPSVEHLRHRSILYLVGSIADRALNGIDQGKYDKIDMRNVDRLVERIVGRVGRDRWSTEQELSLQTAYAEAIVATNMEVIRELAERLMDTPPRYGRRVMDGETFRMYANSLVIVDP